jgi:hypothetical protein
MTTITAENCAAKPDLSLAQPLALAPKPGDEKPVISTFDAQTPCFMPLPGAKSLYRVFALPQDTPPYTISVASTPFGPGILAMHVVLLDSEGSSVREIQPDQFMFRGDNLTTLFRNHPGEHYLLVGSDPAALGKTFQQTKEQTQVSTMSTGFVTFQMHTGTDTTNNMIYTANGQLSVTLALIPPPEKKN